jgi:hypothetical protein
MGAEHMWTERNEKVQTPARDSLNSSVQSLPAASFNIFLPAGQSWARVSSCCQAGRLKFNSGRLDHRADLRRSHAAVGRQ